MKLYIRGLTAPEESLLVQSDTLKEMQKKWLVWLEEVR